MPEERAQEAYLIDIFSLTAMFGVSVIRAKVGIQFWRLSGFSAQAYMSLGG